MKDKLKILEELKWLFVVWFLWVVPLKEDTPVKDIREMAEKLALACLHIFSEAEKEKS